MKEKIKIGIMGASGYTGADLVRLLVSHPFADIKFLTANSQAGMKMSDVYPHFSHLSLPPLVDISDANWDDVDVVFCGLPHGTTQNIIRDLPHPVKIIDLSADFRLRDPLIYEQWYDKPHEATELQKTAVYGLSEHYRTHIKDARLIACPGCYPTAALLMLLPLLRVNAIQAEDLIIDAKSGVTGAGRSVKQGNLFCELSDGMHAYGVGYHRHMPEIEQELSKIAMQDVKISFTPHLVPMNRGEYLTIYAKRIANISSDDLRKILHDFYKNEPFVHVLEKGKIVQSRHVRGSNFCYLSVHDDRLQGRSILISSLDNLVKGSAGQAVQNMNIMFGLDETMSLMSAPLFP